MKDYRPDIDGLRAIAVMAVVLFHLDVRWFGGGFVGVDVFFVISGYLITKILMADIRSTGRVDFRNFYIRRARRILPALAVTLAGCFVATIALLDPTETASFGWSMLAAITSLSNVYFWSAAGYFDTASTLKPLLHTWSLSVEEQFYLVWPLILGALALFKARGRHYLVAVLAVFSASLGLNQIFVGGTPTWLVANWPGAIDRIQDWRTTIFYQMPFRAFELSIGALLVWMPALRLNWLREVALAIGLALIGWCVLTYSEDMVFPAVNALAPCIGAFLVLYGGKARILGWGLRNRAATGVGLISYSFYLVHWPLIVFYQVWSERPLETPEKAVILVVSICLAALMLRFVENPFRQRRAASGAWKWALAAVAPLVMLAPVAVHATGGMLWRMPQVMAFAVHSALDEFENRGVHFRSGRCFASGVEGDFYADFDFKRCIEPEPDKRNFLLVGDSIAAYAYGAMQKEADANGATVLQLTLTGCRITLDAPGPCAARNQMILNDPERFAGQEIVLMGAWGVEDAKPLRAVISRLKGSGLDVTVVGAPIVFTRPLPDMFSTSIDLEQATADAMAEIRFDTFDIDRAIRAAATEAGAEYFSVVDKACPQMTFDSCHVMINGSLITFDQVHMTHQFGLAVFDGAEFLRP